MKIYDELILENRAWALEKKTINPVYFEEMSKGQTPRFLWIGCADSRVHPSEITGTLPGDMFVHRNIANLVVKDDLNILSVLTYGIEYLKIRHIIVCGHYGCGGVQSSLLNQSFGIIDGWIKPLKDLQNKHATTFSALKNENERTNKLVELSVLQQLETLASLDVVKKAWANKMDLYLHGWVYDMASGLIKELTHKTNK